MLRRHWVRAERDTAKRENGRVQPASGAAWHSKGDVVSKTHLVQVKSTEKKSYTLKLSDMELIEQQAAAVNKDAKMIVEFLTPRGRIRYRVERDW